MTTLAITDLFESVTFSEERHTVKPLYDSDKAAVTVLGLEPGQSLTSQVSPSEVLLYVVQGSGRFLIANEESPAHAGSTVICAPNCPHGIRAEERMIVMLLTVPRPA